MDIDQDFIDRFKAQIRLLEGMKQSVEDAIERANAQLVEINKNKGEPVEKVFVQPKE
ncbi:hypothetical protein ACI2KT_30665 [Ensifer adhaerens]|uniref:hypothetical protein n=1 Tax=Ensifer adhaerens TaxID=106592 RepID=UPI0038513476